MNEFKLVMPLTIRFSDFDSLGHVNNAAFLTYLEEARIHYFGVVMGDHHIDWQRHGLILARVELDFLKPLTGYHHYFVGVRCARIGHKSFLLHYEIVHRQNNSEEKIATAQTVMVSYDYEHHCAMPVSAEMIAHMELYEGAGLR